jgi:hypothetical protein
MHLPVTSQAKNLEYTSVIVKRPKFVPNSVKNLSSNYTV